VEPAVFAAVQEQLQENKRHARQHSRRGALYLLQGLLQCQHCGDAFYGVVYPTASDNYFALKTE